MATILVVDDSAVDRALARELLGKEPHWKIEHAENCQEALMRMKESPPDVVVTDLQMPGMDGLEFVTVWCDFHSGVPVILMTAHGSESLALEALQRGAASYVPKSQLVDTLLVTVKQVLALARADRSHRRLIECLTTAECAFSLENDLALVHALVDLVQGIVGGTGLCDLAGRLRVGMALEQALHNALYWGNLEITLDDIEEAREQLLLGKEIDFVEHAGPKCHIVIAGFSSTCGSVPKKLDSLFAMRDKDSTLRLYLAPMTRVIWRRKVVVAWC